MFEAKSYPSKALKEALILVSIFVLTASLESLMLVKDLSLYREWAQAIGSRANFGDYKALISIQLIFNLIIPLSYSIYIYLANKKIGYSGISRWLWILLLFYSVIMKVFEMRIRSVFWYAQLIALIVLLIINISIPRYGKERNKK